MIIIPIKWLYLGIYPIFRQTHLPHFLDTIFHMQNYQRVNGIHGHGMPWPWLVRRYYPNDPPRSPQIWAFRNVRGLKLSPLVVIWLGETNARWIHTPLFGNTTVHDLEAKKKRFVFGARKWLSWKWLNMSPFTHQKVGQRAFCGKTWMLCAGALIQMGDLAVLENISYIR